jgi:hypothetical protein
VHDIRDGKISPWVILNCSSGKKLISNMNDDQLELISPAFDIAFWVKKFKQLPADVALVQEILKEADVS